MKFWALLALAASIAVQAFPLEDYKARLYTRADGKVVTHIGYRVVKKEEAEKVYKNDNKAVQSEGDGGRQIGEGIYILNKFKGWTPANDPKGREPWDCMVTVDSDEWDKWNKAWLPELFTFPEDEKKNPKTCMAKRLWYVMPVTKRNRNDFLKLPEVLGEGSTYDNTVLFSVVKDFEPLVQALLPPALIATGKVYLTPCAERKTEASDKVGQDGPADWGFVESLPGYGMGQYRKKW